MYWSLNIAYTWLNLLDHTKMAGTIPFPLNTPRWRAWITVHPASCGINRGELTPEARVTTQFQHKFFPPPRFYEVQSAYFS